MGSRIAEALPRVGARVAGVFYLLTFVAGILALVVDGKPGTVARFVAAASYVGVTLLFYGLFEPVSKGLSLAAAAISFVGLAVGPLRVAGANPLVFFGFYCIVIGYLVFRSTFLPRSLGVLMACSSLGWLTFLSPGLARSLYPYNLAPGIIGEGALMVWLLVAGVDAAKWQERALGSVAAETGGHT